MNKIKYILIALVTFFAFQTQTFAYVRVNSDSGLFDPVSSNEISPETIGEQWPNGSYPVLVDNTWLTSFDQVFYLGSGTGTYFNVNADYYVGINSQVRLYSYVNGSRSSIKPANLRCGIGEYREGYDSSYVPEISNFEIEFYEAPSILPNFGGINYLFHIKFNYTQQINKVNFSNQNASCWFERGVDELAAQITGSNLTYNVAFWSRTNNLQYSISEDPLASYLGDMINQNQTIINQNDTMVNQNQTIINQNNQTNQSLEDINSTLNDDTPPNADISSLGNVQGLLKPGPVDSLLNIPAQFLSVVTSSLGGQCKPISGTWVYDQSLTFPCFDQIIWNDFEDTNLLKYLELIPCAFILIVYFKHLYKKVDRATSMNSNSDDEWGVI